MLTSITPLGERSRGSSWTVTVSFFATASLLAGAAAGALAGGAGALLPAGRWRIVVLLIVLVVALALDCSGAHRLPGPRRQVNEDWLGRYRGWVYGGAFGAQLGVGLATVVISAATYVAAVGALLGGSAAAGALAGGTFGLIRGLSVLPAAGAVDGPALVRVVRRQELLSGPSRAAVVLAELAAGAMMLVAVLR
jgi:hypothetical protein